MEQENRLINEFLDIANTMVVKVSNVCFHEHSLNQSKILDKKNLKRINKIIKDLEYLKDNYSFTVKSEGDKDV
ncbi:hypothetical protein LCGC14_1293190 [marine sediment metagenome]|uniref:Uncharacterized protein n=1 Tax=marine sediment metagenome TaxID=412755 RepID=A0A0F9LCP0_9ZZZZ